MKLPANIFATLRRMPAGSWQLALFYALILQALFLLAPSARAGQQAQQQARRPDEVSTQLAQARAEASTHHYDRAIELYRSVLTGDPDNRQALGELADTLETAGRWHEALPLLQHLLALQPDSAPQLFQLGRMESWSGDTRADGLALLRRAAELDAQRAEYLAGYAEVLSWEGSKRSEAAALFERALALDARNEAVLVPYAEMLSWSGATRPRARTLFDQALTQNPRNARALAGRGLLNSWTGRTREALADYDAALALDPANAAALRGKAEILNWRGQHLQARDLLDRSRDPGARTAGEDPRTLLELARANAGLGRYRDALALLDQVPSTGFPEAAEIRGNISRGQATFIELGFGVRHSSGGVNPFRLEAAVSTPLGAANRITLLYRPTFFQAGQQPPQQRDFNSNYFGAILDSQPSDRLTISAELGGETYPGAPSSIDGAFEASYNLQPSLRLAAGFRRQSVDDTRVAARGDNFGGVFIGQVRSNLASAGFQYGNFDHGYDVALTYTDGIYTGHNLDNNRRWGVNGSVGKTLHGDHPYFRVAYNFIYLSFAHDANFQPGVVPNRLAGGYFSPTSFLANSGSARVAYHWHQLFEWYAEGSLGAQNVETTFSRFGNAQFASTFGTGFLWRPGQRDEIRGAYEYLDIFNAFRRHIFRIGWRHYF